MRSLGDSELRELVDRYVDAWERTDIDAFVGMLTEDATFAMPPLPSWYGDATRLPHGQPLSSLSGAWRWRTAGVRANAQPALGFYA